jgi:hypothetical protein
MTRFPHDQFAKDYLKELLSPLGEVETSRDVPAEVREIDVWFTPTSTSEAYIQILGLLGRIAIAPAIFEPFRNAVSPGEIRSCLGKLFDVCAELERRARRDNQSISQIELPKLWIFTPTASAAFLEGFNFQPSSDRIAVFLDPLSKLPSAEFAAILLQLSQLSNDEQAEPAAQQLMLENLLGFYGSELDEQLMAVVPNLLALATPELTELLQQFPQLSRDELLALANSQE